MNGDYSANMTKPQKLSPFLPGFLFNLFYVLGGG